MSIGTPYSNLPDSRYWKRGVSDTHILDVKKLYTKKFTIGPETRIATAGSCFAQHISQYLRQNGFSVVDKEPAPSRISINVARKHGFSVYSARYGNIYTSRQFYQLLLEAFDRNIREDIVWEMNGRFYDSQRPNVTPQGLGTAVEVIEHRERHLHYVRDLFKNVDLLIFTMGLTEAWVSARDGTVYPTAPGVIAGKYDPELYKFKNFTFSEIYDDTLKFISLLRRVNKDMKIIFTVSPVPLIATASCEHVLVASTYSKSVLRAVAGQLAQENEFVDYFPSYEIIATHPYKSVFYDSNLRTVNPNGVEFVMKHFFSEHEVHKPDNFSSLSVDSGDTGVICEEALLEAFG